MCLTEEFPIVPLISPTKWNSKDKKYVQEIVCRNKYKASGLDKILILYYILKFFSGNDYEFSKNNLELWRKENLIVLSDSYGEKWFLTIVLGVPIKSKQIGTFEGFVPHSFKNYIVVEIVKKALVVVAKDLDM